MFDDEPEARWRLALGALAVLVGAALALAALGRTPWGSASGPGLWAGDIHGALNSQYFADPYSFTHVNHGLLFFLILWAVAAERLSVGARFLVALVVEAAWEVVENSPFVIERFRETTIAQGYYGDSILNSVGDILACVLGFWIAYRLPNRWVVALFFALEVALVLWIRDSMVLTLVMLIYPIPGLREWQFG